MAIHLRFSQILSGFKKDFRKWRSTEIFSQIWLQTRYEVQIFNQPSVFMDAKYRNLAILAFLGEKLDIKIWQL